MSAVAQPAGGILPELEIDSPERQRRLTVLLRILLLIPQYIILTVLSLAATVTVIIGWFAALVLGRLPEWAAGFLSGFVSYMTRVLAYNLLLVDRYPPVALTAPEYPARVYLQPGRLNRLAVLFRIILVIPAQIVSTVVLYGWSVCAFFLWLVVLITGRTPRPVFDASAAVLRYYMRYYAYYLLLTAEYPKRLFGDPVSQEAPGGYSPSDRYGDSVQEAPGGYSSPMPPHYQPSAHTPAGAGTRPLMMSGGGRTLLVVFIVVGALAFIGGNVATALAPPQQADNRIQTTM